METAYRKKIYRLDLYQLVGFLQTSGLLCYVNCQHFLVTSPLCSPLLLVGAAWVSFCKNKLKNSSKRYVVLTTPTP